MTSTVGIVGYPLRHSVSPAFQQAAFDHLGIDARYLAWETPPNALAERMESLRGPSLLGANVTVPHKQAVVSFLDEVSQAAQDTGAVNTIVNEEGRLTGHNTDATGFLRALQVDAGFQAQGKRVLVLGAGGSARAVVYCLLKQGAGRVTIANRTVERAHRLIQTLGSPRNAEAAPLGMTESSNGWDLIVNCTTLGMRHAPGEKETPLPSDAIPANSLVYDLVYNPEETPLLQAAAKAGARTLGGLPMLIYQGAEAFRLWTGREAPVEVMFQAARRALRSILDGNAAGTGSEID